MNKETGGPAFPTSDWDENDKAYKMHGITMRDYFAAKALQGMSANPEDVHDADLETYDEYVKEISRCAYELADAMMEARK
jgi:hypothetical protein